MKNFGLPRRAVFEDEAHARFHLVEALPPGGAGVDKEHAVQCSDAFDLEDVAVAADEHVGGLLAEDQTDTALPSSGSSGDVSHPEREPVELEALMLGRPMAQVRPVDVAPDGAGRGERFELVQDLRAAYIAGVQDQIDVGQNLGQGRMEIAVRVGENAEGHWTCLSVKVLSCFDFFKILNIQVLGAGRNVIKSDDKVCFFENSNTQTLKHSNTKTLPKRELEAEVETRLGPLVVDRLRRPLSQG